MRTPKNCMRSWQPFPSLRSCVVAFARRRNASHQSQDHLEKLCPGVTLMALKPSGTMWHGQIKRQEFCLPVMPRPNTNPEPAVSVTSGFGRSMWQQHCAAQYALRTLRICLVSVPSEDSNAGPQII